MSIKRDILTWKSPGIKIEEKDIARVPVGVIFRKYTRRSKLAKIFGLDYKDNFNNPNVLWSSNTAKPYKKFIIPLGKTGPSNNPEIINSIEELNKKFG